MNAKPRASCDEGLLLGAKDQYFVRLGSAAAIPIYNVKKLVEWLPDHKKSIASFVKRKKTSLNEKDLMELIAYYNNL